MLAKTQPKEAHTPLVLALPPLLILRWRRAIPAAPLQLRQLLCGSPCGGCCKGVCSCRACPHGELRQQHLQWAPGAVRNGICNSSDAATMRAHTHTRDGEPWASCSHQEAGEVVLRTQKA